ncbi:hypothetical protein O181_031272 [Austropuccinia psidii MF-1]|uniref:Uncharacterized protein n=1 Tax=Austropuccinia psidii MF-1 TaxID=1389203 RepID=A0A9Q3CXB1_9BASI|nr:hypothetical protein [Austropuccinia psidii MF-1]
MQKGDRSIVISRHVKFDNSYFPSLPTLSSFPQITNSFFNYPLTHNEEPSADTNSSDSWVEDKDIFHNALEELPERRIRVIGPRNPMIINSEVSMANILLYRRRAHQTTLDEETIPSKTYEQAMLGPNSPK